MALSTFFNKYVGGAVLLALVIGAIVYGQKYWRPDAPTEFSLPVPFTTQAPNGNWDNNEDCEEASATMANAYFSGNMADILNAADAVQSIKTLVAWEQANLGHNANTGADETAKMIEGAFHLKTKVVNNLSESNLKKALLDHQVVLLPLNAQGLNHPNYRQGSVLYHMVVIVGYTPQGFVVHDPGSEDGRGNLYAFDKLFPSAADWDTAAHKLISDKKVAIIVWK